MKKIIAMLVVMATVSTVWGSGCIIQEITLIAKCCCGLLLATPRFYAGIFEDH